MAFPHQPNYSINVSLLCPPDNPFISSEPVNNHLQGQGNSNQGREEKGKNKGLKKRGRRE